jgi:ribonuclease T2
MPRFSIVLVLFALWFHNVQAEPACQIPDVNSLNADYAAFQNHKWTMSSETDACLAKEIDLPTDFFMLSISYSPKFCEAQGNDPDSAFQCKGKNHFTWVVHGLWAESNNPIKCAGKDNKTEYQHPRYCQGDNYQLIPLDEVSKDMCTQPGVALIEKEWAKHGTCSGMNQQEYLAKTQALFAKLNLPDAYMQPPQIFKWIKQNNPELRKFYLNFDKGAHELRVCYTKDFQYTNCPKH